MQIINKFIAFGLIFLITGCSSNLITLDSVIDSEIITAKPTTDLIKYRCSVGAHRGASKLHTENTIQAIATAAKDNRYAFIEFDVRFTKDDSIVAFHDKSLIRLYGNFNKVSDLTYNELTEITGNNIALYSDIMDIIELEYVNIEIKSNGDKDLDQILVDRIADDICRRNISKRVMISSISADVLKYINTTYPKQKTGQVFWIDPSTYVPFDFLTEDLYKKVHECNADYLLLHVTNLHNLDDLIDLKPNTATIIFWNFDDKMYLVHKDPTDILWGSSLPLNYVKYYTHTFRYLIKSNIARLLSR